jgi:hypothetical protein
MTSTVTKLPGRAVRIGFEGLRAPLSLAEKAGLDLKGWPPVVAYEAIEAQAKRVIGLALGDEGLVEEGDAQADAAMHRARALFLRSEADSVSLRADGRLSDRADKAEKAREAIEDRAAEWRAEIEQEERQARAEVERRAKARDSAVKQAARSRQKAAQAKERQAKLAGLEAESKALDKEKEALEAERVVTAIDEHLRS